MPLPSPVGFAPSSSYEGAGGCRGDTGSVMACLAPQPQLSPLVQEDFSHQALLPTFPRLGSHGHLPGGLGGQGLACNLCWFPGLSCAWKLPGQGTSDKVQ